MRREKSCGALIIKKDRNNIVRLLLIRHKHGGHWSFPKGHMEGDETEIETAMREVREETGKDIKLIDGFRERVDYSPKPHVEKQVIYFLAGTDDSPVNIQEEEISGFCWMEPKKAYSAVTFENDRRLIQKAIDFLNERS